jgi:hypothetical protein
VYLDGDREWPTIVGTGSEDYVASPGDSTGAVPLQWMQPQREGLCDHVSLASIGPHRLAPASPHHHQQIAWKDGWPKRGMTGPAPPSGTSPSPVRLP